METDGFKKKSLTFLFHQFPKKKSNNYYRRRTSNAFLVAFRIEGILLKM